MAGIKLKIKRKLTGSTILEVVISMVIIMVVFNIAMMIYANVTRSSLSIKKLLALNILSEVMQNTEKGNEYSDQTFSIGIFRIEQTVTNYHGDKTLVEVDLYAYDANQQIADLKKIIIRRND